MPTMDPSAGAPRQTRHARMKQILDTAAGASGAIYQGKGRFWDLPLAELLEFSLYGVRMIAPAASPSDALGVPASTQEAAPSAGSTPGTDAASGCCGSTPATDAASGCCGSTPPAPDPKMPVSSVSALVAATPGRGAASGLIQGLHGQFPFDGSHFPRLPWGGTQAVEGDILFIQNWIDAGCSEHTLVEAAAGLRSAAAQGRESFPVSKRPTNAFRDQLGEIKQRKNIESLSDEELTNLRTAMRTLMQIDSWPLDNRSYSAWARLHGDACPHGWSPFLPWHRIYLWEFEMALQDIIPTVTLPYWDWTAATPDDIRNGVIPAAYRGWLTQQSLGNLTAAGMSATVVQSLAPIVHTPPYNSINKFLSAAAALIGAAAIQNYKSILITELKNVNPLFTEMRFPGDFFGTLAAKFHHHYPRPDDIQEILQIDNWTDFGGGSSVDNSFGALDMNPHNTMHIWIGGYDLTDLTQNTTGSMLNNLVAAFDPIFWAHHANLDRLYAQWQDMHPGQNPPDASDTLADLSKVVGDAVSIAALGYDYAAATYVVETAPTEPISLFHSSPLGVHPSVLKHHHRAEVKIHGIRQPTQSFAVSRTVPAAIVLKREP